uniref:Uncharacterized protein n=2 Tax=Ursus TaxID=9639 RepID=A0A452T0T2_URSMA
LEKSTFILIIKFYVLILQFSILNNKHEPHMITCSAFCGLYITDNLSFKTFFQEMNASLKVIDFIHAYSELTATFHRSVCSCKNVSRILKNNKYFYVSWF